MLSNQLNLNLSYYSELYDLVISYCQALIHAVMDDACSDIPSVKEQTELLNEMIDN